MRSVAASTLPQSVLTSCCRHTASCVFACNWWVVLSSERLRPARSDRTAASSAPVFLYRLSLFKTIDARSLSLAHSSSSCSRVTRASWNVSELCWRLSDSISVGLEDAMALHLRHSSDGGVCCDVCLNEQGNVYVILRRRSPPAPCEPPARQHSEDRTSGPKGCVPGSQRAAAIAASTWRPRVHGRGPGS